MIPSVPCSVCGEGHNPRKCTELNPPSPEGLPNSDGGGKHAQNPIEEDDSLAMNKIVSVPSSLQGGVYQSKQQVGVLV